MTMNRHNIIMGALLLPVAAISLYAAIEAMPASRGFWLVDRCKDEAAAGVRSRPCKGFNLPIASKPLTVEQILKRDGYLDSPSPKLTEAQLCEVDVLVGRKSPGACKMDDKP